MSITAFNSHRLNQKPASAFASTAMNDRKPVKIPTSMGTLEFMAGVPTQDTLHWIHNNLLLVRAVEVFLRSASAVSLHRLQATQKRFLQGRTKQPRIFFKAKACKLMGGIPRLTKYNAWSFIDLTTFGPTIIELPRGIIGIVNDMWFRVVGDIGRTGHDLEGGEKYLILPPDYKGDVPAGYFVLRPRTSSVGVFFRPIVARFSSCFTKSRAVGLKIYPLSRKEDYVIRSEAELINGSQLIINEITPLDDRFFGDLDHLLQNQPVGSLDKEKRSLLASIGLVKGRAFRPTIRVQKILRDAVAIGHAALHALARSPQHLGPDRTRVEMRGVVCRNDFYR
jgi:hypothetical protein